MTVESQVSRADYIGNSATVAFTIPFYFLLESDLQLLLTNLESQQFIVLQLGADYSVTGAGEASGGTATLTVAPSTTEQLTILRDIPLTQITHFIYGDPLPSASIENSDDKLTMITQQLNERLDRALVLPPNSADGNGELPTPVPNFLLGWDEEGSRLQNVDPENIATDHIFGKAVLDIFDGDGVTTQFALTANPGSVANLNVSISGLMLRPTIDFVWSSGVLITFMTPPPVGTQNVLVQYMRIDVIGEIEDGSITEPKMADNAVSTRVLQDGSVTEDKIGFPIGAPPDGSITTAKLADGAVTTPKLADEAVTFAKLGDGSVTDSKIVDLAVTTSKIANLAVTTNKIANYNVTTIKIADGAVTADKLAPDAMPVGGKESDVAVKLQLDGIGGITLTMVHADGSSPSPSKPLTVILPSASASDTTYIAKQLIAPLTLNIPAGASFGALANVPFKLWFGIFLQQDQTPDIWVFNSCASPPLNINPQTVSESSIRALPLKSRTSFTPLTGGSTQPQVFYGANGVTAGDKSFVTIGFTSWENGLVTPGNYDALPTITRSVDPSTHFPGTIVSSACCQYGGRTIATSIIPYDDTIPQSSEGSSSVLNAQIVNPLSRSHMWEIEGKINVADYLGAGSIAIAAVFVNNGINTLPDAIVTATVGPPFNAVMQDYLTFYVRVPAYIISLNSSGLVGFMVRWGVQSANGGFSINGNGQTSTRLFGGNFLSYITVREIAT